LRLTRTHAPIEFRAEYPLFQAQPLPRACYADTTLNNFELVPELRQFSPEDWDDYYDTVVRPNVQDQRPRGQYATATGKDARTTRRKSETRRARRFRVDDRTGVRHGPPMRYPVAVAVLALPALLILSPTASAGEPCPVVKPIALSLPRTRELIAANRELVIVAIGSSSTEGWMASTLSHSYPAMLQADLAAALPNVHVAVVNRGVGGQDAAEEVPRLDTDVVAVKPTLVIWQVGANGALRNADPKLFQRLVTAGIDRLKLAKLDIIMMDNQQAPMILAASEHALINQALAGIAKSEGVNLFSRNDTMEGWKQAGYPIDQFIAPDGLHHNDLGYACIANALAVSIANALTPSTARSEIATTSKPHS